MMLEIRLRYPASEIELIELISIRFRRENASGNALPDALELVEAISVDQY